MTPAGMRTQTATWPIEAVLLGQEELGQHPEDEQAVGDRDHVGDERRRSVRTAHTVRQPSPNDWGSLSWRATSSLAPWPAAP